MAYTLKDDEDKVVGEEGQPVTTSGPQSSLITGQGTTPGPDAPKDPSAAPGAAPGNFVGIQQYIDANKPQSAGLAQKVGSYVEGLGQDARNTLESSQKGFQSAVGQGTVNYNKQLADQAAGQGSAQVAGNAQQLGEFQSMRDAQYKGPENFQGSQFYQPAQQSIQQAQQAANQVLTQEGQKATLAQMQQAKRGRVNTGALNFDAALLQTDPDAKRLLGEASDKQSDLGDLLSNADITAGGQVTAGKATTAATKKAIADQFGGDKGVQKNLEADLVSRAQVAIGQSSEQAKQTIKVLTEGGEPNEAQLKLLGISKAQYDALIAKRNEYRNQTGKNAYDSTKIASYSSQVNPATNINAQNIASAEDYARYQALNQLMGTQNQFLSDPSQAGKSDMDSLGFNLSGATSDMQGSIDLDKSQKAQAAADAASAAARKRAQDEADAQERAIGTGATIGFVVGGPVGAVVGGVIGAVFCFAENSEIMMSNGSFKKVQNLRIGDMTAHGGMVLGHGVALCQDLYEHKGVKVSSQHLIFEDGAYTRADKSPYSVKINLESPIKVYPVVNENHILISTNGVVYGDMVEVDATVGLSDADKLFVLNNTLVGKAQEIEDSLSNVIQMRKA